MEDEFVTRKRGGRAALAAACFLLALAIGIASLLVSGAWTAGFSGADEPAHFLNAYFIAEYARSALGSNPLAFATEFYLHYPKISIGHWPPAYYGLLSPFFFVLPATPQTGFALNLLIASLPAALLGLLLARLYPAPVALVGALLAALSPVAIEAQAFFMLDQAVAAAALGAAMLWMSHAERPAAWKAIGFGIAAATAVLVKGNGWLLLFMPPLHIAVTNRWRLLLSPWPWAAAIMAALLVGPWYWLTAGISADGFNHEPGLRYAWQALSYNAAALAGLLSLPGLALAGYGIYAEWTKRHQGPARWNIIAGCISLAASTLLLQSLVPVDLDPRYLAPAVPPLVLLALCGAMTVRPARRTLAFAACFVALAAPGALHLAAREPKVGLRMQEAAGHVRHPSAWVIDGTTGAEGAFVAAMAVQDRSLRSYAVRSSKLLAASDFMGSNYRLAFSSPADILARLKGLGIDGVVVSRIGGEAAFPHSEALRRALLSPASPYRLIAALPHRGRAGTTEIFRSVPPRPMNEAGIRDLGLPGKAAALGK